MEGNVHGDLITPWNRAQNPTKRSDPGCSESSPFALMYSPIPCVNFEWSFASGGLHGLQRRSSFGFGFVEREQQISTTDFGLNVLRQFTIDGSLEWVGSTNRRSKGTLNK